MPESRSHLRPYQEPERHDGLSSGVPQAPAKLPHNAGAIAPGETTRPRMGGQATKNTTHLSHRIDSATLTETYQRRARTLRRALCGELARTVGGGACGIIPSLFVKHACVATALAEQALDEGDKDRAVKYAEASRMHLLYARELCAKDAASRPHDPTAELTRRILARRAAGGGDGT